MKRIKEYREMGLLYLSRILNSRVLLFKIPKMIVLGVFILAIVLGLLQFVDGKQSLQRWEQGQIERKVYLLCSTREENRYKGAFIPIGSTFSESVAEEKTKKAIASYNNEVIEYKQKRSTGETKRRYSREKEAQAFWAEDPSGQYGILVGWEDTPLPRGYTILNKITK